MGCWCAELHDRRCIRPANAPLVWPLVDLRTFRDRNFTVGCVLSFVLGIGLFGSVYLMPVFLVYVRGHSAFEVGMIIGHRRRAVRHRADRGRARSAL